MKYFNVIAVLIAATGISCNEPAKTKIIVTENTPVKKNTQIINEEQDLQMPSSVYIN